MREGCIVEVPRPVYEIPDAGLINTLSQVRESINPETLEELAESISQAGSLINPVTVAAFSKRVAREYVDFINKLHNASHSLEELERIKFKRRYVYLILIAGHRRLAAIRLLAQKGIHIPIVAFVHQNLSVENAVKMQIAENTHERVAPEREATVIRGLYELNRDKIEAGEMSFAEFVRKTGRSESAVRGALRFTSLPTRMQSLAYGKDGVSKISYGALVEIARYQEFRQQIERTLPEDEMLALAQYFLVSNMTVQEFKKYIQSRIEHDKSAGADLFGEGATIDKKLIRQTISKQLEKGLLAFAAYIDRVAKVLKNTNWTESYSPNASVNVLDLLLRSLVENKEYIFGLLDAANVPNSRKEEVRSNYYTVMDVLARTVAK